MAIISVSGGDKLQDFLNAVVKKNGSDQEVSVGFMDGATYPDGTSVPMIAALMNYGTMTIPPRPFFSNMVKSKKSGWGKSLGEVLKNSDYDSLEALKKLGLGIGNQLNQSIHDTNSPPLAMSTILARAGKSKHGAINSPTIGKVLIDTAVMINAIQYEVSDGVYDVKDGS